MYLSGSPSSLVFILEVVRLLRLLCLRNKNEHCVSVYNYMNANTEEAVSLFCGPSNGFISEGSAPLKLQKGVILNFIYL